MRITYLISRYGSGAISNQPHVELIDAWRALGVEVNVLSLAAGDDRPGATQLNGVPVQRLPVNGHVADVALKPLGDLLFHYRYFLTLLPRYARAIRQCRSDLVHVESAFPHGVIAALSTRSVPLALTLQGADVMSEPAYDYGYGRYWRVRAMLRWVFQRALLVRGDSEQIRDLAVYLGCDPAKAIAVPYNITWSSYLSPDVNMQAFRATCRREVAERHGLDPAAPLVLSLSRLHPFKGVEYLVQATPAILDNAPSAQIMIAGPSRTTPRFGDYGAYLRRMATDLAVDRALLFPGAVPHDQARHYFAAADVIVVPSVVEAFNRVLVEAAAVGTPAVVTATTGVSDYAGRAGCALVVAPKSAEQIAGAVSKLLLDDSLRAGMGTVARTFAQDFSPQHIARQLLDSYTAALMTHAQI